MKTSNYIAISFLIFLFGGIFVLFLSARIDPRGSFHQEFLTQEKALDSFSVIVAEQGAGIHLKYGQTSKMVVDYPKGDTCSLPPFTVRNDTLFVSSYSYKKKQRSVDVYCSGLKSIQEKNAAHVTIERQFQADTLLVKLDKAEFSYYSEKDSPQKISLTLIADQSKVQIGETDLEKLDIQLNNTEMNVWNNSIGSLSGSIKNQSKLYLDTFRKISLEVDSTSTYRLNN
jgi:hypothetical protein